MKRRTSIILVIIASTASITVGVAFALRNNTSTDSNWRSYESTIHSRAKDGKFSGAILVAKNDKILLNRAYGYADSTNMIANTPGTQFCIASMGKMFTSVAIGQLVEQEKLSFDDTIGRYVSGLQPEVSNNVTIGQLLSHTSGLGDMALGGEANHTPPMTLANLVAKIKSESPQFTPGTKFSYSNDGFILLGAAIETITHDTYESYVTEHVLQPAGMTDTKFGAYYPRSVKNLALPNQNANTLQVANPSGGAYSTTRDMLRFAQALTSHKLLGAVITDTITTGKVDTARPGPASSDKYAYGFAELILNKNRIIGHNGGTPGYEAQLDIYPDSGYVVIILTNQDSVLLPAIQATEDHITKS